MWDAHKGFKMRNKLRGSVGLGQNSFNGEVVTMVCTLCEQHKALSRTV